MDAVTSSISAPQVAPTPLPDVRPTADAAAIARDPSPTPSMAIPASMAQSGAVNESRMTDTSNAVTSTKPTERVLKPFGVEMLPHSHEEAKQNATAEASEEAATDPAEG